jgi:hypothetical protein
MADYWARDGSRVVVRLPAGIVRMGVGGILMVAGVFVLVAILARQSGVGTLDGALLLEDALEAAALGLVLLVVGFVVAFYRHRIVIDGAAGDVTFLHDFWLFRRARRVSLVEYTGTKVDRRAPVGARPSSLAWYWVSLVGKGGKSEDVVALGSPVEAEDLRDDIAAVMRNPPR